MIDAFVYQTLAGDDPLRDLLGATEDDPRIDPRVTAKKTRAIAYKAVPGSYDGHFHTDRIEIRIIDRDDDRLRAIQERVLSLLVLKDDDEPRSRAIPGVGTIVVHTCKQNGGGELEDEYDTHRLLYFNVIWRAIHG